MEVSPVRSLEARASSSVVVAPIILASWPSSWSLKESTILRTSGSGGIELSTRSC